jgi:hypothetical protein
LSVRRYIVPTGTNFQTLPMPGIRDDTRSNRLIPALHLQGAKTVRMIGDLLGSRRVHGPIPLETRQWVGICPANSGYEYKSRQFRDPSKKP